MTHFASGTAAGHPPDTKASRPATNQASKTPASSRQFVLPAPAKLNLFLHVTGRREDGYHELQTLFQLLDFGDTISLQLRQDRVIELLDDFAGVAHEQNLIVRAARLLQQRTACALGATIRCTKRLPQGGGLGGGSSNAATTLAGLNQLWQTAVEQDQLAAMGLELGADVPVFVRGRSAWAEGVGERLCPVRLPHHHYLVIDPSVAVPTAKIFNDKHLTRNSEAITLAHFLERGGRNDCEPVARRLFPAVEQAFQWLSRYTDAHLSGTGGCIFGAFEDRADIDRICASIPAQWNHFTATGVDESPLHQALIAAN